MEHKIDILLSTYNGELFLTQQIDSILSQTYKDWHLTIRDDGSIDGTLGLVKDYCKKYPDEITFSKDNLGRLGLERSFSQLLEKSSSNYVMFCDQDDVWLPEKVEKSIKKLLLIEKEFPGVPALIFTDLEVVDSSLNHISSSFWKYQCANPKRTKLNHLLVQNMASGNTMIMNRALGVLIGRIPAEAIGHDWWTALTAAAFGKIGYLPEATIKYRQHSGNTSGALGYSLNTLLKFWPPYSPKQVAYNLRKFRQAVKFLELFSDKLSLEQRTVLHRFIKIYSANPIEKICMSLTNGFLPSGVLRTLYYFVSFIFTKV